MAHCARHSFDLDNKCSGKGFTCDRLQIIIEIKTSIRSSVFWYGERMELICDGLVAHSGWTDDFHCLAARKPRISIGPIRLMAWGRVCILACFHINWTKFWLMRTTLHFRLLQPLVFGVYIQVLCYLPVHEAGWLNFIHDISLLMSDRI